MCLFPVYPAHPSNCVFFRSPARPSSFYIFPSPVVSSSDIMPIAMHFHASISSFVRKEFTAALPKLVNDTTFVTYPLLPCSRAYSSLAVVSSYLNKSNKWNRTCDLHCTSIPDEVLQTPSLWELSKLYACE